MPIHKSTHFTEIYSQKKVALSTHDDRTLQDRFEKIMKQKKYPTQEEENLLLTAHSTHSLAIHNNASKKHQPDDLRIHGSPITLDTKPRIASQRAPALPINEIDSLRLRLTQGPLAGVILSATLQQGSLKLCLNVSEQKKFKKIAGQHEALRSLFGANLDMPLILEVAQEENSFD